MNQERVFCQSCGMPMDSPGLFARNADGGVNTEYCSYCFKNNAFTADMTMEEMIDFCVGPMVEHNEGMTPEQARGMMEQFFPTLKRWKK